MRSLTLVVLCSAFLLAAPVSAQEEGLLPPFLQLAPAEPPATGWLPWLVQLEAEGATIGEIRIDPQNIFDLSDPQEDYLLYRLANAIHIVTRQNVIRRTLLFKSGEKLSVRLIEESERVLRSTLQIYSARIRAVAYNDGVVDLEVVTRDRWTLEPSLSFGRSGGVNSDRIGIKDSNLFGTGTSLGFSRSSNVDRTSNTFNISHPHFFAPFISASYAYADTSDGRTWATSVNRPFYALDTRNTWGIGADASTRAEAVYVSGVNTGTYQRAQNNANGFWGLSGGLIDGWTRRHTFGYSYSDNSYASIAGESPAGELPADITLSGPYYQYQMIQDRFRTTSNLDSIGKPEDINVGLNLALQVGRSFYALGSTQQQWLYTATLANGWDVGERAQGLLRTNLQLSGRYASGAEQQLSMLDVSYFHRQTTRYAAYASFAGKMVVNPDAPNPLTVGGDNDLKGYPLRYQSGNKSIVVNLEERAYTDWYPFRLIRVGGVVFYDGGRAWGGSEPNTGSAGWLNNVGFGLRFLTDRSAVGNVLSIDVAFPLNRAEGLDAVQLLIYTKQSL